MRASILISGIIPLLLSLQTHADGTPVEDDAAAIPQAIEDRPAASSDAVQVLQINPPRTIQIYASDETAEVLYERSESVFGLNNSRANVGVLFNEERDNVIAGSIMYDSEIEFFPGLDLSFGPKLYAGLLGIENADVVGLGANIEAAYHLPIRQFPLELSAGIAYTPDILTFGQSDRIIDWNVRAGLPLTKNITGFVGFRFLRFDTRPGDQELDERLHLGIRWSLAD